VLGEYNRGPVASQMAETSFGVERTEARSLKARIDPDPIMIRREWLGPYPERLEGFFSRV
jgi:hypothetical protein